MSQPRQVSQRHARRAAVLGALAALLLLLPLADLHGETTLEPAAPGSLVASAGLHPGAAKHLESSTTTRVPRCPACDLAQQSAAALGQAAHLAQPLAFATAIVAGACSRPSSPLLLASPRGPPVA